MKKSKCLMISAILGSLYLLFTIMCFGGALLGCESDWELAGAALATFVVAPHMILVLLAVIFNWLGYFNNKRGFALTGGILYCVSGAIFILYVLFVIPSIVLSFVGYSHLKDINKFNKMLKAKKAAKAKRIEEVKKIKEERQAKQAAYEKKKAKNYKVSGSGRNL